MKKIIAAAVFIVMLFLCVPVNAAADYTEEEAEISGQINDILSDYDIDYDYGDMSEMSFSDIIGEIRGAMSAKASAPLRMLVTIIILAVFTSVMRSAGDTFTEGNKGSGVYDMICVIAAVTAITPQLMTVYSDSMDSIRMISGFISIFVPLYAGIVMASGGIVSGSVYNAAVLGASEVIVGLSGCYLMPVLTMTAVLAVTGSVFPNKSVDSLIGIVKKLITWCITIIMSLFCGFVTLKTTIAGKADGAATKTTKFVISGSVPIVGGAVSDAYSTVRGCFEVIGTTVGTAGTIAILLIMLAPTAEILLFRAVMKIGTAVSEMFSAAPLTKLLTGIDSGLAIAQSVLVSYAVMFIICTAILMQN